jgi:hypothetical protein
MPVRKKYDTLLKAWKMGGQRFMARFPGCSSRHREQDYYALLDTSPNASPAVLHNAYQQTLSLYQPGIYHSSRFRHEADTRLKHIQDAYRVLSDPVQRRQYDMRLAVQTRIQPYPTQHLSKLLLKSVGGALLVFCLLQLLIVFSRWLLVSMVLQGMMAVGLVLLVVGFVRKRKPYPIHCTKPDTPPRY